MSIGVLLVGAFYLCPTALEHIQKCHNERDSREQQIESLKTRIDELNAAIARCQEQLPASGAPVTRQVRG